MWTLDIPAIAAALPAGVSIFPVLIEILHEEAYPHHGAKYVGQAVGIIVCLVAAIFAVLTGLYLRHRQGTLWLFQVWQGRPRVNGIVVSNCLGGLWSILWIGIATLAIFQDRGKRIHGIDFLLVFSFACSSQLAVGLMIATKQSIPVADPIPQQVSRFQRRCWSWSTIFALGWGITIFAATIVCAVGLQVSHDRIYHAYDRFEAKAKALALANAPTSQVATLSPDLQSMDHYVRLTYRWARITLIIYLIYDFLFIAFWIPLVIRLYRTLNARHDLLQQTLRDLRAIQKSGNGTLERGGGEKHMSAVVPAGMPFNLKDMAAYNPTLTQAPAMGNPSAQARKVANMRQSFLINNVSIFFAVIAYQVEIIYQLCTIDSYNPCDLFFKMFCLDGWPFAIFGTMSAIGFLLDAYQRSRPAPPTSAHPPVIATVETKHINVPLSPTGTEFTAVERKSIEDGPWVSARGALPPFLAESFDISSAMAPRASTSRPSTAASSIAGTASIRSPVSSYGGDDTSTLASSNDNYGSWRPSHALQAAAGIRKVTLVRPKEKSSEEDIEALSPTDDEKEGDRL